MKRYFPILSVYKKQEKMPENKMRFEILKNVRIREMQLWFDFTSEILFCQWNILLWCIWIEVDINTIEYFAEKDFL